MWALPRALIVALFDLLRKSFTCREGEPSVHWYIPTYCSIASHACTVATSSVGTLDSKQNPGQPSALATASIQRGLLCLAESGITSHP